MLQTYSKTTRKRKSQPHQSDGLSGESVSRADAMDDSQDGEFFKSPYILSFPEQVSDSQESSGDEQARKYFVQKVPGEATSRKKGKVLSSHVFIASTRQSHQPRREK